MNASDALQQTLVGHMTMTNVAYLDQIHAAQSFYIEHTVLRIADYFKRATEKVRDFRHSPGQRDRSSAYRKPITSASN